MFGPHEFVTATILLTPEFAEDAEQAHAKLLTLMVTEDYFELPTEDALGFVALFSDGIRSVAVWSTGACGRSVLGLSVDSVSGQRS